MIQIALLFNDNGFAKQNRKVALVPQEGNSLDPVLPVGYLDYTARVPKSVDADCIKDAVFSSEYSQLFPLPHLELIHSSYVGVVGVQESSLKASPLHKKILQVLSADDHKSYKSLSSHAMKMARQLYETNASIPAESISLINKTRNGRRRLFRKQQKKKQKYERKGNTREAQRCQVRLDTYREVLAREVSVYALST
ncbi:unnamed protein product [Mucor fragilis]